VAKSQNETLLKQKEAEIKTIENELTQLQMKHDLKYDTFDSI
jgi:hypothetical protein